MKQLRPVIWAKGTFLSPQHLQLQDRFIEESLSFNIHALKFRPWGFSGLCIDEQQLADGQFVVSRASGIFSDGLVFDVPDSDSAPPARALGDLMNPEQKSLPVYLAIPAYRPQGLNIAMASRNGATRFVSETAMYRDENTGVTERPVQLARKNLRLLAEGENREGYSCLQIANVVQTQTGAFLLDGNFVPPLLDISASPSLTGMLRGLVEILSAKSSLLSGYRRQKNESLADFTAVDIANFWLLYTINQGFPAFKHLLERHSGHPEELYSAMMSLAGALMTFSLKLQPRDLPRYDHDNLGPCFRALDEKLRALLETVVPSNFVSLPLRRVQPSIYATAVTDDRYLVNTRMFLAISCELPEGELIKRVPQLVKVCSATHIDHLVKQALPGMQLTHTPKLPTAFPIKLNYQYFSLSQSGAPWEAVKRARNLAAYVPGDFPNAELELLILLPQVTRNA